MPHIEQIPPELAWPIRHQAMYPDKKLEHVKLADEYDGIHFGLFDNNQLISVVSWFNRNENEAQFRKLATLEPFRNLGYGTLLMRHVIDFSESENMQILWCNARVKALNFYTKLGFRERGTIFYKNGIDSISMELELKGKD